MLIVASCLCLILIVGFAIKKQDPLQEQINLVLNNVKNVVYADIDVQITKFSELSKKESDAFLKEFETTTKTSYKAFTSNIPNSFVCDSFYLIRLRDFNTENEYIPHDYVFEYTNKGGQKITLAISSDSTPLRDVYIDYTNPQPTIINNVSMYIFFYQKTYIVQFYHNDVYYDIEATNITSDTLIDLLISITN